MNLSRSLRASVKSTYVGELFYVNVCGINERESSNLLSLLLAFGETFESATRSFLSFALFCERDFLS